jgi:hypothetical protein
MVATATPRTSEDVAVEIVVAIVGVVKVVTEVDAVKVVTEVDAVALMEKNLDAETDVVKKNAATVATETLVAHANLATAREATDTVVIPRSRATEA